MQRRCAPDRRSARRRRRRAPPRSSTRDRGPSRYGELRTRWSTARRRELELARRGRWSWSRPSNTVEFVTTYLALARRRPRPAARRRAPRRARRRWDADAVDPPDGRHRAPSTHRADRRAAPRPRPAAEHVGVDRVAEARPAVAPQRASATHGDRAVPRADAGATAASRRCRCTTATGCRSCTPTSRPAPAIVLTDASVVDPCFAGAMQRSTASRTSPASRTRSNCSNAPAPTRCTSRSLRFMTQAGGRMPPDRARRRGASGPRSAGASTSFVMYGQTEATARMAYLPPALAARRPDAIGVPIPGGADRAAARSTAPPTASASSSTAART